MNAEEPTNTTPTTSPDPIFQILTGFWASKALMAAVELELFTKLSGGKQMTLNELQQALEMEARPTDVFASALASLGLLQVTKKDYGERRLFANSPVSEMFLDKSKASYMGDIISMFDKRLYKAWDKLVESLQTNKPVNAADGGGAESIFDQAKSKQAVEEIQKFTHAMHGVSIGPAMQLPKEYDFSKHSRMMDIGGGSGVYAIQVVKANPHMKATILDLEAVCQVAEQYIKSYNLEDKIKTKPLDFFKEDIPKGYDVAFLSLILHDYSEEKGIGLLKKIYDGLANDGVVIISEWLLNDENTGPAASALMGLNMIVETYGGKNYSYAEIVDMLNQAGFKRTEKRPLARPADILSLVTNHKQKRHKEKIGAVYKGVIIIMSSNEIDVRRMNEDNLEEADRITKLDFGGCLYCLATACNKCQIRQKKREKIVRPKSCIAFPVHTTASTDH